MSIERAGRVSLGRNIEPVYLVHSGQMIIEAPLTYTWPHVVNYPSWQTYSSVQHISGNRGEEGEVVLLRKEEAGFVFPAYYARTVRIEPEKKIIWKTYLEKGTHEIDRFGIVEFRLLETDCKTKTRFDFNLIYEFLVPYIDTKELLDFRMSQYENFRTLTASTHPKLKQLVESSYNDRGII